MTEWKIGFIFWTVAEQSATLCSIVEHVSFLPFVGVFFENCHVYTYLCFGGVPTKTQTPFLLFKKERVEMCVLPCVGMACEKVERYEPGL